MAHRPLAEIIGEIIDSDRVHQPVSPQIARQFKELCDRGVPNLADLAQLISHDPALACSLFHDANSSFYKGLQKAVTVSDAITRIGCEDTIRTIERACRFGQFSSQGHLIPRYLPPLWQHSLGCALGARWLAERCGYQALAEQTHLAGLLHDTGKLFLLVTLEEVAATENLGSVLADQLVDEVLATMHVEQGLKLAEKWHLPNEFAAVIGQHHEADLDNQDVIVALVRLANKGCHKLGLGWENDPGLILPTTAEAQFLGIDEIALAEFEIMLEDRFGLAP